MAVRIDVAASLYAWASERSGLDSDELAHKFPKLRQWESGDHRPTLKQLERFAKATRTPVGYFFLPAPPDEQVPIPDLRTVGDRGVRRPSPDLLDTIYQCQQRQDWYRDYARGIGLDPVPHVGSLSTATPVEEAASALTAAMSFSVERRGPSWSEAFGYLRDRREGTATSANRPAIGWKEMDVPSARERRFRVDSGDAQEGYDKLREAQALYEKYVELIPTFEGQRSPSEMAHRHLQRASGVNPVERRQDLSLTDPHRSRESGGSRVLRGLPEHQGSRRWDRHPAQEVLEADR